MKTILTALVGSKAHGLDTPDSDTDIRSVFVLPTTDLLRLDPHRGKPQYAGFYDGARDDTSFELGYFLYLATKSNPSILEIMISPIMEATEEGNDLRALFTHVWSSKLVHNAFLGYGMSQREKFMKSEDTSQYKFAVAWLRNLFQASELLRTGMFTTRVVNTEVGYLLRNWKQGLNGLGGAFNIEEVLYFTNVYQNLLTKAYESNPNKEVNYEPINDYLLKIRKENF